MARARSGFTAADLTYIAVFTAIMAVCAWICIPAVVPFTLQTLGLFLALLTLGGRRGTLAVLAYVLLGAAGAPVFSGFTGGVGRIAGPTGGFITGFVVCALVMWALEKACMRSKWMQAFAMALSLLACYAFGTAWFMVVSAAGGSPTGIWAALSWCVLPYVIPDLIKLSLACAISSRLSRILKKSW